MLDSAPSRRKGRRQGLAIRPGAVKAARLEAGLTLAQLGGAQLTKAAVHQIETGKARPSLDSVKVIARRTRKPLRYFLTDLSMASEAIRIESLSDRLEDLSAKRRSEEVIAVAAELARASDDPGDLATARFYLGQAHYRLLRPREAVEVLRAARAGFEAAGESPMIAECMLWEATALSLYDEAAALPLAESALELVGGLKPPPARTLARVHGHLASLHRARQDWPRALQSYERAVEIAGPIRDLQQLARLYDDMAEVYQHLGQPAKALDLINQAIRLYAIESDPSAACRAENNLGDILMQQGQLDAAEPHFLSALEGSDRLGLDRRGRAYILANLGELYLRRQQLEAAQAHLDRAREVAAALSEQAVLARVDALLGQVAEGRGDQTLADRRFRTALERFAALDIPDRLRRTHMAYAEILETRGDYRGASEHWRQAARLSEPALAGAGPSIDRAS